MLHPSAAITPPMQPSTVTATPSVHPPAQPQPAAPATATPVQASTSYHHPSSQTTAVHLTGHDSDGPHPSTLPPPEAPPAATSDSDDGYPAFEHGQPVFQPSAGAFSKHSIEELCYLVLFSVTKCYFA